MTFVVVWYFQFSDFDRFLNNFFWFAGCGVLGARVSRGGVLFSLGFFSSLSYVVCACFFFCCGFQFFFFAVVLSLRAIVLRAPVLFFLSWFRLCAILFFHDTRFRISL